MVIPNSGASSEIFENDTRKRYALSEVSKSTANDSNLKNKATMIETGLWKNAIVRVREKVIKRIFSRKFGA